MKKKTVSKNFDLGQILQIRVKSIRLLTLVQVKSMKLVTRVPGVEALMLVTPVESQSLKTKTRVITTLLSSLFDQDMTSASST